MSILPSLSLRYYLPPGCWRACGCRAFTERGRDPRAVCHCRAALSATSPPGGSQMGPQLCSERLWALGEPTCSGEPVAWRKMGMWMVTMICQAGTLSGSNKEILGTSLCVQKTSRSWFSHKFLLPGFKQVALGEFLGVTITFYIHDHVARAVVSRCGTCQTTDLVLGFR